MPAKGNRHHRWLGSSVKWMRRFEFSDPCNKGWNGHSLVLATLQCSFSDQCVRTCASFSLRSSVRRGFRPFAGRSTVTTVATAVALINGLLALRHFPCEATLVFPDHFSHSDPSKRVALASPPSSTWNWDFYLRSAALLSFLLLGFNDRCIVDAHYCKRSDFYLASKSKLICNWPDFEPHLHSKNRIKIALNCSKLPLINICF